MGFGAGGVRRVRYPLVRRLAFARLVGHEPGDTFLLGGGQLEERVLPSYPGLDLLDLAVVVADVLFAALSVAGVRAANDDLAQVVAVGFQLAQLALPRPRDDSD